MKALFHLGCALSLGFTACSAPYTCETERNQYAPDNLSADTLSDSHRLDSSRAIVELKLRASLTGLPTLWQSSTNIIDGRVKLSVTVDYEGEPKGNDGRTEMPRVETRLTVWGEREGMELQTSSFANGIATDHLDIFRTCDSPSEPYCCRYGQETCSLLLGLRFQRLDGEPFPPVVVAWEATPSADVTPCPLESEVRADLSFERESP